MNFRTPDDQQSRRLFAALAMASGRPEDRFAPDWRMPYVADLVAMLRGEREPEDDRERRALAAYRLSNRCPDGARDAGLLGL